MRIYIKSIQDKVNYKIIQISFWDCCGHDKFAINTPHLFKNASIAILVYTINNINSFEDHNNWYNILKDHPYDSIIFLPLTGIIFFKWR